MAALLGICFWREGLEAALGPEQRGERGERGLLGQEKRLRQFGDDPTGDLAIKHVLVTAIKRPREPMPTLVNWHRVWCGAFSSRKV